MRGIFGLLYSVVFILYVLAGFFVLFHISRYALNRRIATLAAFLFIIVTTVLLFANAFLFFHLPLDTMLQSNASSSFDSSL